MAINLKKGQRIDLTKGNAGLSKLKVGLGWDEQKASSGGFFKKMFGGGGPSIDCDASALLLNENGKITNKKHLVYYGNLKHKSMSVQHMGDNLTGEGDGDDEVINIDLNAVPDNIHRIVFVVNIYDCKNRNQDFGMIQNAFIRMVDNASGSELARYNLSENYSGSTTLTAGEVYRHDKEWKFAAIGEGSSDASITDVYKRYS